MADQQQKNDNANEESTPLLGANDDEAMTSNVDDNAPSPTIMQSAPLQAQLKQQQFQQQEQQNATITPTPAAPPSTTISPPPPLLQLLPKTTRMSPIAPGAAAAAAATASPSPSSSPRRSPRPPPLPRASAASPLTTASPQTAIRATSPSPPPPPLPGGSAAAAAAATAAAITDELPSNVNSIAQLSLLPMECWTGSTKDIRPLRHVDEWGKVSHYALNPTFYSVYAILIVELLERFAFYGINYTQTSYLTGAYNADWNADMDAVWASTYVSISVAVAYTAPFVGAHLADAWLGDYMTILMGTLICYLPGLFLIAATTVPGLVVSYSPLPGYEPAQHEATLSLHSTTGTSATTTGGDDGGTPAEGHFNRSVLAFALLFLWPVGTGIVKSAVNVFGARQFHPLLQSAQIESYYVNFYTSINVGALLGGIMVPLLAQVNVTAAYLLPAAMLLVGVVVFGSHQQRYVQTKPSDRTVVAGTKHKKKKKKKWTDILSLFKKKKRATAIKQPAPLVRRNSSFGNSANSKLGLMAIVKISVLVVPFNIAYSQMSTTFIVQGTVMAKAFFGLIDAACMNNADAVAVLFFGYVIGSKLYPALAERGIRIPTAYKFAMGSMLGALAIGWALMVESMIHSAYHATGEPISILWQAPSYILIGAGEIWACSAAYEAVFNASAAETKVLASAINLFFNGGLPNVICIFLYNICAPWFRNGRGTTNITHLRDYATANIANYFWVLFIITMVGVIANVLPVTRQFMQNVEDKAAESIKTPKTPSRPPTAERRRAASAAARLGEDSEDEDEEEDEEAQLLRAHRHELYLKYGSGPVLHKAGSMRAGVSSIYNKNKKEAAKVRRKQIEKLYKSDFSLLPSSVAASPAQLVPRHGGAGVMGGGGGGTGAPILAPGTFLMPRQRQQPQQQPKPPTGRHFEKQSSM